MLMAAVTLMVTVACNDIDCPLYNKVQVHYALYNSADQTPLTLTDTLTVKAIGSDSILYNRAIGLRRLTLPMSYTADADTLLFEWHPRSGAERVDTVIIVKTNQLHSESMDCSMLVFHTIRAVYLYKGQPMGSPTIDSIVIRNREVTYEATEHLQVYIAK